MLSDVVYYYVVRHNYRTPEHQMAQLCYGAVFRHQKSHNKHEIMLYAIVATFTRLDLTAKCLHQFTDKGDSRLHSLHIGRQTAQTKSDGLQSVLSNAAKCLKGWIKKVNELHFSILGRT